jgi:hypothetical protein
VHAGLLNVLHDAADHHTLAIGEGVNVHFGGIVEEAVEQHRRIIGNLDRLAHVALEILLLVDDFHRPARPARSWDARPAGSRFRRPDGPRLPACGQYGLGGCFRAQFEEQLLETLTVFGSINHVGAGADDGHPVGLELTRPLQRGLPTKLHDHAHGLLDRNDLENVFQRQRLEVQTVGGVVVG